MKTLSVASRFRCVCAGLAVLALMLSAGTVSTHAASSEKDIVDTAVSAGSFKTLVAAVKAAGLVDTLKGSGPFTVFAPNDEAFQRLPKGTLESLLKPDNKDKLIAILTYHVVPNRVLARDAFGLSNAASVNGQRLKITNQGGKISINDASLLATDIECSNGVIHVIDRVLLPEQERIPTVANNAGLFGTLLAAVGKADLADVLNGDGPFTVLAPTDEAFNNLPEGTVESLLKPENKGKLVDILKYHVLSGRVYSDQVAKASQATTLLGREIEPSVSADGLKINDSLIVQADIDTANGVIHVIDSVLLPRSMSPHEALQTLKQAIKRGVPLFNHGNSKACADIYMEACQPIIESADGTMPKEVMATMKTTVDRANKIHNSGPRAWALRHGMDSAMHAINRVMRAD